MPEIGDEHATREHVDNFYNFWYSFESWREYSYLDEEDKERGQDREERRWIEKQNKAIRIKRKKEEMSRIRTLVDLAYNNDPRILKFKNEDKEKKQAAKRARMTAAQAQRAEEEKIIREAQLAKEKAEQAEQKRIEQIRLEKEKEKKALKKERKMLRDLAKENNYYSTSDKEKIKHMEGVEKICEMLKYLELQGFNKELAAGGQKCFKKMLDETEQRLEEERKALFNTHKAQTVTSIKQVDKNAMWSPENVQILIKAVNLFPAGTVQRWEVIANYINQHGNSAEGKVTARDVLNKAKTMQSSDFKQDVLKQQVNNNAFESFEKSRKDLKKIDNAEISVNVNGYSEVPKQNGTDAKKKSKVTANETNAQNQNNDSINAAEGTNASTWTKEEQALLEQAMKTYPVSTVDRWDRIAECIPDRTKKDCLRRVKELVDLVNAKREAQKIKK